jgi:hypothetical protein
MISVQPPSATPPAPPNPDPVPPGGLSRNAKQVTHGAPAEPEGR